MAAATIIAIASLVVSGSLGVLSLWLALRKRSDDDALGRASRRTTALQLLSDEEFTLIRVRDECVLFDDVIIRNRERLGATFEHFASESKRITHEAAELLLQVRGRRSRVEPMIQSLAAVEIESIIASSYHGKRMAEAQLQRTMASTTEIARAYSLHGASASKS